ncbi:hypothetical protein J2755_001625 [Methanohalophilus levihalophilus]|uniref:DUF432 domain-containing protein n=1 Tax=Methanohalophilus levihalophilus TaxID=1431282 RepID=UPI001AE46237|nr:DUF432 domain-containing protein [Methanohalophilus levihalophilus]MBP2030677.1 hypothetical protein [Methanohalophilus levihalophilus]
MIMLYYTNDVFTLESDMTGDIQKNNYGSFGSSKDLTLGDLEISVFEENGISYYKRIQEDVEVKKVLSSVDADIVINPIEPVNLPKDISSYLLVEFESPLLVPSLSNKTIYVTFPIEIGIFLQTKKSLEVIDIVSIVRPKFTLYGTSSDGIICRYHKSAIYSEIPVLSSFEMGVIELTIDNKSEQIAEVNKIVLSAYGMKIYYDEALVSMKANMEINSKKIAETKFIDHPILGDMLRSRELYSLSKIHLNSTKYVMEKGI